MKASLQSLLLFFLLIFTSSLNAQVSDLEESQSIGELEDGAIKLVSLKNGNTAFFHFQNKKFVFKLFDTQRKLILERENAFANKGSVKIVWETDNDIVLFLSGTKNLSMSKVSTFLYRVHVDATTGVIEKEHEVGHLIPYGYKDEIALQSGYLSSPAYFIKKDPGSNTYAVAAFDSFESDRNKRLKIIHFSSDHQIVNQGYFQSKNDDFKYINYIDMLVLGDSKVIVAADAYNTGDNKKHYLCLGSLEKGTTFFKQKVIESANKNFSEGCLALEKGNINVIFFGTDLGRDQRGVLHASSEITVFDPTTLDLVFNKSITPPLEKETQQIFSGIPLQFAVNDDGTYSLVYRDVRVNEFYKSQRNPQIDTYLESIYVQVLDNRFIETESYAIQGGFRLTQNCDYLTINSIQNDWKTQPQSLWFENEYKGFLYLYRNKNMYLFLNGLEENGTMRAIFNPGESESFLFTNKNGKSDKEVIFKREFPKEREFLMFSEYDYNPATDTYVTIRKGNRKGWLTKIVWFKIPKS